MRLRRRIKVGVLLMLLCLVITVGCASGPGVGSRAPSFSAINGSGGDISFANYEAMVPLWDRRTFGNKDSL